MILLTIIAGIALFSFIVYGILCYGAAEDPKELVYDPTSYDAMGVGS